MMKRKQLLSVLLVCALCLGMLSGCGSKDQPQNQPLTQPGTAEQETAATSYKLGGKLADFSFTDYEGNTVTLYETLQEKKLVLINFWATWCGPCGFEFPFMEQAYKEYQDQVEIFAMSVEPSDSDEVLADYAAKQALTFPMGRDTSGLGAVFAYSGIPTTVLIDRFGTICLIETGAQTSADAFRNVFEIYTAEDYFESVVIQSMRAQKATAEPVTEAQLADALNGENGKLIFTNSKNPYLWPMQVTEAEGRRVVTPSNVGVSSSEARVSATVDAKAGDGVALTFKMTCEDPDNRMEIKIDGKTVKTFSSNRDWITYTHAFAEAGEYTLSVCFVKGGYTEESGDTFWLDSIRHLTGEEAREAVSANLTYPVGESSGIEVLNPGLKKLVFYDTETDAVVTEGYICPEGAADLRVTLDAAADPELSYLMDSSYVPRKLTDGMQNDGYHLTWQVSKAQVFHDVALFVNGNMADSVFLFVDEDCVEQFAQLLNPGFAWKYVEDAAEETLPPAAVVSYSVRYLDQNGEAVPGVMCQVCDESICQVFVSDENGECRFALAPYAYEVHTLKLPEGYAGDTDSVLHAPKSGGELVITLQRK